MAALDDKIAALEAAASSGLLTFESNGERLTYARMSDLLSALTYFKRQQAGATGAGGPSGPPPAASLAVFGCD